MLSSWECEVIMNSIIVKAQFNQEAYINPADVIAGIKDILGFSTAYDSFLTVNDGQLVKDEDISYHGSPMYEYKTISNNPKWIELFNSIQCIEDYLNHYNEPQWNKIIEQDFEQDFDEDEDNAPVMGM